ncbi:MAG: hypothetical protein ABW321_10755 [Polyangiales bacterium]
MLVVLLILLTGTALAATALQTTQFELRSSGYNRAAVQTQYVSEAAAMTTFAWIDAISLDRGFLRYLESWRGTPPLMGVFGEPDVPTSNRANANRTQWDQQQALLTGTILPPITVAGFTNGTTVTDPVGTFGPRSTYVPGVQIADAVSPVNYVVDLYDCRQLPNTGSVGFQINQGGSGSLRQFQYYCVVTSRGRSYVPFAGGARLSPTKTWQIPNAVNSGGTSAAAGAYVVNRFQMAHDSRGTIVTPPI